MLLFVNTKILDYCNISI